MLFILQTFSTKGTEMHILWRHRGILRHFHIISRRFRAVWGHFHTFCAVLLQMVTHHIARTFIVLLLFI